MIRHNKSLGIATATAGEIAFVGDGRGGDATRDGASNGASAAAVAADLIILFLSLGEAQSDRAGAFGVATTSTRKIIISLWRGSSGDATCDRAGNDALFSSPRLQLASERTVPMCEHLFTKCESSQVPHCFVRVPTAMHD